MGDESGRGRGVGRAHLLQYLRKNAKEREQSSDNEKDDNSVGAFGFESGRRQGVNRQTLSGAVQAEQSYDKENDADSFGSFSHRKSTYTESDENQVTSNVRGHRVKPQNSSRAMVQTGKSNDYESNEDPIIPMLRGRGVSQSDSSTAVPYSRTDLFRLLQTRNRRLTDDIPSQGEDNSRWKNKDNDNLSSGSSQRLQKNKASDLSSNVRFQQPNSEHSYADSAFESCSGSFKSFGTRNVLSSATFDQHSPSLSSNQTEFSSSSRGKFGDSGVEFLEERSPRASIKNTERKATTMVHSGHPSEQIKAPLVALTESMQALSTDDYQNKHYSPSETSGTKGIKLDLDCNYVRIEVDPTKGIFHYEVKFSPNVDNIGMRMKILNKFHNLYGGVKTFDGVQLYIPSKLPNDITTAYDKELKIEMKLIFKGQKSPKDCSPLYNILFDRVMKTLKYVRHARRQFDPTAPKIIPQAKLEIWPGYVTCVDEYKGGLMLCCDVSHRILCQKTVLEELVDIYSMDPANFQANAIKSLVGCVALTRYNNKTYRIDDINFKMNPKSTFKISSGEDISFENYFKECYNIVIKDTKQPLLTSIKKVRKFDSKDNFAKEEQVLLLVPEITHLTGLRDSMRSDFRLMQEVSSFTRVTPAQRIDAYNKLCRNIERSPEATKILSDWGLRLSNTVERIIGRNLDEEMIFFKHSSQPAGKNCDFTRHISNNEVLNAIPLTNWCIIYHRQNNREFRSFADLMNRNCDVIGIRVFQPKVIEISDVALHTFVDAIRSNRTDKKLQIIVVIVPNLREDRYSAIKKVCSIELAIPSQVIHAKTLSRDMRNKSIVMKIALQINCKLGGALWSVKIPFKNVMICGIDTYHDAQHKNSSVAAFVASLDSSYTRWFSKASIQTKSQELVLGLTKSFQEALKAYLQDNGTLPNNIIVYRDGVSDSQLNHCLQIEVPQLETCAREYFDNYNPKISFIVVQKRINTRFFNVSRNGAENPGPGTVVDSSITRFNMYDFFLVSQSVRQGTVSPAHYIVIRDDARYSPDILQRLSYKLTFMYYNWSGTIGVPACCQYAHKLAFLVGQSLKRNASERLEKVLYYL